MRKIFTGIGIVGLITLVWFIYDGSTIDHVATVDDELSQLEQELAKTEDEVAAGFVSPKEAAKIQDKVFARLETITTSVEASQGTELTEAQRVMLHDGLERLKKVLVDYQETLLAVDGAARELSDEERSGGTQLGRTLPGVLSDAIETVAEYVGEGGDSAVTTTDETLPDESSTSSDVSEEDPVELGDESMSEYNNDTIEVSTTTENGSTSTTTSN